jgi:acetate kinase
MLLISFMFSLFTRFECSFVEVMAQLKFINMVEDVDKNRFSVGGTEGVITSLVSSVVGLVIPTNEELFIAKETDRVLTK